MPDKPWRPYLSTFYGAAEFDDDGPRQALITDDVEDDHTTVLSMPAIAVLVDQGTFAPGEFTWNTTTARGPSTSEDERKADVRHR